MCTATSAGRHLVVGISSLALTQAEEQFLHRVQPAGVILFSRNIQDPDQVQALIASVRDRIAPTCTIWLDQEGGRVQRLRDPFTRFPSPWQWVTLAQRQADRAADLARLAGEVCGRELAVMGIGVNCAPVLDIREPGADPVIGERAFGETPQGVIALAGVSRAREGMTGRARAVVEARIRRILAPCCPVPGDWRALLRQPDYRQARHQLEAVVEENRQADPTEPIQ